MISQLKSTNQNVNDVNDKSFERNDDDKSVFRKNLNRKIRERFSNKNREINKLEKFSQYDFLNI